MADVFMDIYICLRDNWSPIIYGQILDSKVFYELRKLVLQNLRQVCLQKKKRTETVSLKDFQQ